MIRFIFQWLLLIIFLLKSRSFVNRNIINFRICATTTRYRSSYQCNLSRLLCSSRDDSIDSNENQMLDPIEYVKETKQSRNSIQDNKTLSKKSDKSTSATAITTNKTDEQVLLILKVTPTSKLRLNRSEVDNLLQASKAELAPRLPFIILKNFQSIYPAIYIPVTSLILLTSHIMVLIPVLQFVQNNLHSSIFPYLYIGPILIFLPFIFYWLWDNNTITNIPIVNDKILESIINQKNKFITKLNKEDQDKLYEIIQEDAVGNIDTLDELAFMQVYIDSTINNPQLMVEKVLVAKTTAPMIRLPSPPLTMLKDMISSSKGGDLNKRIPMEAFIKSIAFNLLSSTKTGEVNEVLKKLRAIQMEQDKDNESGNKIILIKIISSLEKSIASGVNNGFV